MHTQNCCFYSLGLFAVVGLAKPLRCRRNLLRKVAIFLSRMILRADEAAEDAPGVQPRDDAGVLAAGIQPFASLGDPKEVAADETQALLPLVVVLLLCKAFCKPFSTRSNCMRRRISLRLFRTAAAQADPTLSALSASVLFAVPSIPVKDARSWLQCLA